MTSPRRCFLNQQSGYNAPETQSGVVWRYHLRLSRPSLHTRRVVGWAMSGKPDAELAIKALEMAYQQRGSPAGVLFHSDQGRQYGSRAFRQRLWSYRMTQSMSRRGNCWDNALMERLFRNLKSEWLPVTGYMSLWEAKRDISYYLIWIITTGGVHTSSMTEYRQQKPRIDLTKCPDLVDHYNYCCMRSMVSSG
jgi:putative transposase